jgi:hypothetical protein
VGRNPYWRKRRRKRRGFPRVPALDVDQILDWVDAHHTRTGVWPKANSGVIPAALDDTWYRVDKALRNGTRSLPGGSSLARFLETKRGVRNIANLLPLKVEDILAWADAHHEQTGDWPHRDSGDTGKPGETWANVDAALRGGLRGLRGGSSLARLLARYRQVANPADRPLLSDAQILRWAERHHRRTGDWPTRASGAIVGSKGDTWLAIDAALHRGLRSLPGGTSLAALLTRLGARNHGDLPPLTEDLILTWVDAHRRRTGRWPQSTSGAVANAPGETWSAISKALCFGHRKLPGGASLAELLVRRRGVRNNWHLPKLTVGQILAWADDYHTRHGRWPTRGSGAVREAPQETWQGLIGAVRKGRRGLPGGSSLNQLLAARRAPSRRAK